MYRGFPAIRLGITIIVNSVMPRYPIKKAISTKRMKLMTGNIGSVPNVLKILAACLRKQLNRLTEPSKTGVQFSSEWCFSAFSHGTDKNKQIPLDLNGSGGIFVMV